MSTLPSHILDHLTEQTRLCISRLTANGFDKTDISQHPRSAAVLVLLFEKAGQLRVLLTTRSKQLRTHPGQTALPGGRKDVTDRDFIETALREANEEVALPRHCPNVHLLGALQPYTTLMGFRVSSVVAFLSDNSILDRLKPNPAEVDRIFEHPLEGILDPQIVKVDEVSTKPDDWPYEQELFHNYDDEVVPALGNTVYRVHHFRTTASLVTGLTSDILLDVAEIAYGRLAAFERYTEKRLSGI
ncbi:hypothetical protein VKT23_011247 [Stygiomarasmius scandens]|uniref:Nudix hydrolase domain-containing protein n=1 Tax=Marasmiellus scandens TaxID=2682957 RepID=A0ABR1J9V3_9AGAR